MYGEYNCTIQFYLEFKVKVKVTQILKAYWYIS